ncbi:MAG: recombinase family protein, partial [Patescibacteria group bacterium]
MDEMDFAREAVIKLAEERRDKNLKKRNVVRVTEEPRYVIYARRSTKKPKSDGSEDKQERSIEDQIKACKQLALEKNLPYQESEILIEEETSHKAGKREVFYEMLDNIRAGKYNSIIAWHPDRLARNMKDAGSIIDMLDTYTIIDLKFPSYSFTNDPSGKMALGIQFVLAKQYSDALSVTTKRGTDGTAVEGKYLGKRKIGYKVVSKFFRQDNDELPELRKAWDLALKNYSLTMICDELRKDNFKYKVIKEDGPTTYHRMDEKRLSRFFKDTFYAGVFLHGANVVIMADVDKNFTPMVSYPEFLRVREILDKRKFYKAKVKNHLFTQFVKCESCGRFMSMGLSKARNGERHLYLN